MQVPSILVLIALVGCKSAPPPTAGPPHFVVADVIVSVRNQSGRDIQVSLASATGDHPLGPVPGGSSRSFSLPSGLGESAGDLRFEARDRRGAFRSNPFSLSAGQKVVWTIDERGSGAVIKQ